MLKLITAFLFRIFALSLSEEVGLKYQSLNLSSTKTETDASKSCSASMTKHVQLFARQASRPLKKSRNSTRKLSNDQPTFAWEPCHFLKDITARNRIRQLLEESLLSSPFLPIATTQTAAAADVFTSCTSDNHRWTFSVFYYLAIYTAVSFCQ